MSPLAPTVVVRPMTAADADDALAIDAVVYPTTWSRAFLCDQLSRPETRVNLVAEADGRIVGHAALMVVADEGHVTSVAVMPEGQRSGIGTRLLAALCRAAVDRGLSAMTLEVRVSNTAAIGLYRRFGFAPAGVRAGYYGDDGEDALVMWAHDIAGPAFAARLDELIGEQR